MGLAVHTGQSTNTIFAAYDEVSCLNIDGRYDGVVLPLSYFVISISSESVNTICILLWQYLRLIPFLTKNFSVISSGQSVFLRIYLLLISKHKLLQKKIVVFPCYCTFSFFFLE